MDLARTENRTKFVNDDRYSQPKTSKLSRFFGEVLATLNSFWVKNNTASKLSHQSLELCATPGPQDVIVANCYGHNRYQDT